MSHLEPLCVTPVPFSDESWNGYVLRLSGANYVRNPSALLRHAGLDLNRSRKDAPIAIISELSNKTSEKLSLIHYASDFGQAKIGGNLISKSFLQLGQPKICPQCINDIGYIPAKWDLIHLKVCSTHMVWLDEICNSCQRKLSWERPRINKCKCKSVLKQNNFDTVPEAVLDLSKIITAVFEGKKLLDLESTTGMPFEFLSSLTLNELLEIIDILGNEGLNDSSALKHRGRRKEINIKYVCLEASYALSNWPYNFNNSMETSWIQAINSYEYGRHSNLYFNLANSKLRDEKIAFFLNQILRNSNFDEADLTHLPVDNKVVKLHFQKLWYESRKLEETNRKKLRLQRKR